MPLELRPMVESDFADFVRIQVAAFNSGMTAFLVPQPVTEEYIQKSIEKHINVFKNEPDCHFFKVVDTDAGDKMIAGSKWRINERERTEQEIQGMLPVPGADEEGRPASQDFMWYINRSRRKYMGTKPFYLLHILITDLEHHRRGAGSMLIKWGTERADKAQLPAYLEATEAGKLLYARMGFEAVHEEVFELSKYGVQGTDRNTVMIRQPQK